MTKTTIKKLYDSPSKSRLARFKLGEVVKHRVFSFRGVIFDIDRVPTTPKQIVAVDSRERSVRARISRSTICSPNTRGTREYIAYVSEQNLLPDTSGKPVPPSADR